MVKCWVQDRFAENAEYLFAVGRMYALLGELIEARKFVRQAIKLDLSGYGSVLK